MEVLFVSAEVAPYSKVGGLADVAWGLPRELARLGVTVRVVSPFHSAIDADKYGITLTDTNGRIPMGKRSHSYRIAAAPRQEGLPVRYLFIHNGHFFFRPGIYTKPNGEGYGDNNARFFFFQKTIVNLIEKGYLNPEIVHINDHHSALIPLFLESRRIGLPSLLTVHNFQYQGEFTVEESMLLNRKEIAYLQQKFAPANHLYNALEIGLRTAHRMNTVSVTYAKETVERRKLSFGLYNTIKRIRPKFSGILNGVDYAIWNPETDLFLDDHFTRRNLEGKRKNKVKLRKECSLPNDRDIPLVGSISRLVPGKGFDLILDIIHELVNLDIQIVFLGTGNSAIEASLQEMAGRYPEQIAFMPQFDDALAHLIEAGADMFLMPSEFEPCGLNQIYSLKYGTIPIVHRTGGLADTVENWNGNRGTGFLFEKYDSRNLLKTIKRAVRTYAQESDWSKLVNNAMGQDFSWSRPAQEYVRLYQQITSRKGLR